MVTWPLGARPDLSPKDEEVKRKLVKCAPLAYSELIRSDIPGPSSARSARLPFPRSSPLSVMKPPVSRSSSHSVSEPLIAKPTRGDLQACLEVLSKKKRSVKRRPPTLPEGCPPTQGKILKVGASSSPSPAVGDGDPSAAEPPLEVLPILIWCPTSRGAAPPSAMPNEATGITIALSLQGVKTLWFLMRSSLLGLLPPSRATPTSRRWMPYLSRRLWLFCFREPLLYVQVLSSIFFFIISVLSTDFLLLFFFFFWQMAAYAKGLAKRASLTEGSTRVAKSYKAKVASLTSERVGLQAQIRDLTEELVKHRSDLKHASAARAQVEDREKEARKDAKDAKVAEDELRLAREELQTVKGDLWAKIAALERARQEALEAGNSVESLTEELGRLRMDLARQEALAGQRGEVIAELKDEACTQWASGWLAFQRRASQAFLDLEFNIQLFDEEFEGSASQAEVNAGVEVFSGAPDCASVPGGPRVPPGASSSISHAKAPPFDFSTFASWGST